MLTHEHPKREFLPMFERKEPLIKDHTATKLWKECPRKYFLRIVIGRTLAKQEMEVIFGWGNAVHMFMETMYLTEGDVQKSFVKALAIYKAPPMGSKWPHLTVERLGRTIKLLTEFYQKEKALGNVEVKGIEQPFNVELPDGTIIGGRFDMFFTRNDRPLIRDWKTTTKQANWFLPTLNPNDQVTRYVYAASRLAGWSSSNPTMGKIDGAEFVVIENQPPTKSDPKHPKVIAQLISKSHHELIEWEKDQMFIYKQMEFSRLHDIWPKHEGNCSWCDYRTVCRQQTPGGMEWELKSNFIQKFWDHTRSEEEK